jgi:hypothetical protein
VQDIIEFIVSDSFISGIVTGSGGTLAGRIALNRIDRWFKKRDDRRDAVQSWYEDVKINAESIENACYPYSSSADVASRKSDIDAAIEVLKELNRSNDQPSRRRDVKEYLEIVINTYNFRAQNYDPEQDSQSDFFTPDFIQDMRSDAVTLRKEAELRL